MSVSVDPQVRPPDRDALLQLAREQRNAQKLDAAEATCRRVLATAADDSEAHRILGTVLQAQNRGAEALTSFEEAARHDPRSAKAFKHLAIALSENGRMAEAEAAGRRALELHPGEVGTLCHLARMKTFEPGDPDLLALEAVAQDADRLETGELVLLLFTLARAYEDIGDYERSFACLTRANGLKRSTLDYDVACDVHFLAEIANTFDKELLERFADAGSCSDVPVLIVGMPRSGTTLVEQIIASHPGAHGAGELRDLPDMANVVSVLSADGAGFPRGVAQLAPSDFGHLGHGYVERLRRYAPDAARITDKAPMNFRYLGLARLIVPHARIIHCVRDPADTCLSCYGLLFNGVDFGYDLEDLGRYYRAYAELMDHWREVLPAGWMLEVRYEDVVEDFEREARRIVAHCGLDWDDACLTFYAADRNVRTASFAQVRRPVYRDALARARRYEPYLGPLFEALGRASRG